MTSYIVMTQGDDIISYPVDTDAGRALALRAMFDAGTTEVPVYVGEPDGTGESYESGKLIPTARELAELEQQAVQNAARKHNLLMRTSADGACKLLTFGGELVLSCATWGETLEQLSSRGMY